MSKDLSHIDQLTSARQSAKALSKVTGIVGYDEKIRNRQTGTYKSDFLSIDTIVEKKHDPPSAGGKWEEESAILKSLVQQQPDSQNDYSLFYFIEKYGARIGADAAGLSNDISYFDYTMTQEAIKACENSGKYLLVKGDLTGIQTFIYGEMSIDQAGDAQKISKRLRGKSTFISLLTDLAAEFFLRYLQLPQWNLLFAGGGHFNLLVNNTPDNKGRIEKLSKAFNLYLLQNTRLHLGLVVAQQECGNDIISDAGKHFEDLNSSRDKAKYSPFSGYLNEVLSIGGIGSKKGFSSTLFEAIGGHIPKTQFLVQVWTKGRVKEVNGIEPIMHINIPIEKEMIRSSSFSVKEEGHESAARIINDFIENNKTYIDSIQIIRLNNTDFLGLAQSIVTYNIPVSFGYRFLGREAPAENGELLTFSEIAAKGTDYPQLAAMRFDVDNLGKLFKDGLGANADLRRITALSRELNLFFSGYINKLAHKHLIYVVYAGGDDAFVVGSWRNMLLFAQDLYSDFQGFSNQNEHLHYSGGIFICNETYPVARFAKDAEDLEKEAKREEDKKNKVAVFNQVLDWANFVTMLDFGNTMLNYTGTGKTNDGQLSRSLVYKMLYIIKSSFYDRHTIDDHGKWHAKRSLRPDRFFRNMANLRYLFARHGFSAKKIEEAQDELTKKVIGVFIDSFDKGNVVKAFTVALNYVLLSLRKSKS